VRYKSRKATQEVLRTRLVKLAATVRYGYRRLTVLGWRAGT
jgi:hypothetical protein